MKFMSSTHFDIFQSIGPIVNDTLLFLCLRSNCVCSSLQELTELAPEVLCSNELTFHSQNILTLSCPFCEEEAVVGQEGRVCYSHHTN
jgi:hypothetical protein